MPPSKKVRPSRGKPTPRRSDTVKGALGPLIVPAVRATMGTWIYYSASLRLRDVAERIGFASELHGDDRALDELIQRTLEKRSVDIATYLVKQKEERFFNSLVVGVYQGEPSWYYASLHANERLDVKSLPEYARNALGVLAFDGSERLYALDGQHRVSGIRQAIIQDASMGEEQIGVLFVGHQNTPLGLRRTRRLFTTLNRYAKPVAKSDLIALDEDDVIAIVTRQLVNTHKLFRGKTSTKKPKSILPADKDSVTTIGALYDATDGYLRLDREKQRGQEWKMFKRFRPDDATLDEMGEHAASFWTRVSSAIPSLRAVREGLPGVAGTYRRKEDGGDVWVRPIGTMIFSDVFVMLRETGLTEPAAIERIAESPSQLNQPPWTGLLWDPVNHRMITRAENRRAATLVLYYLCGGDLHKVKSSLGHLRQTLEGLSGAAPTIPRPHAERIDNSSQTKG